MTIIGNVGQCKYYVFLLIDRLLLVDGDIVCFPKNYISTDSKPFANLKYELFIKSPVVEDQSIGHFISKIAVSDIFKMTESPIIAFLDNVFNLSISEYKDISHSSFWSRINRWVHGDLSQQGSRNEKTSDNVNSKSLDYSAYNIIFHHLSVFCTIISWIAVLILLILHITSIHFSTFRVIFVSFFVCPLAVAILEGIFQHLYVAYSIGYWKFMKVDDYEEFHCRLLTN